MQTTTQGNYVEDSWLTPRNARTLRAYMALQRGEIAARIAQLRREKGSPPQEVVASQLSVSYRAYQAWESGETRPSYRNVEKLADYYSVTPEYLLLGHDDGHEKPDPVLLGEQISKMADEFRGYVAEMQAKLDAIMDALDITDGVEIIAEAGRQLEALAEEDEAARGAPPRERRVRGDRRASG